MTRDEVAEDRSKRMSESDRQLYESFKQLGMSPAAALTATGGRDEVLSSADPLEEFSESFERRGFSRESARVAAVGRRSSEHQAREEIREATRVPDPPPSKDGAGGDGQRLLDLMESGHGVREAQEIIERGTTRERAPEPAAVPMSASEANWLRGWEEGNRGA